MNLPIVRLDYGQADCKPVRGHEDGLPNIGGKWSGQQDLNLRQVIVITQYDSDKAPHNRCRGGTKRAEFLTFRRRGSPAAVNTRRHAATQAPERPPDPENGSPGAVGRQPRRKSKALRQEQLKSTASLVQSRVEAARAASMGGER
jgi:hypothetical protein